jgi:hypothetical protein
MSRVERGAQGLVVLFEAGACGVVVRLVGNDATA